MPPRSKILPLAVCVLLLGGCGNSGSDESDEPTAAINESTGSFRGVAIGDRLASVGSTFGEPVCESGPPPDVSQCARLSSAITLPNSFPGEWSSSRHDDVTIFSHRGRITALVIADPTAETLRGVGVGEDLDQVEKVYRGIRCSVQQYEGSTGNPYCSGKLGNDRVIIFGGDPIDSIVVGQAGIG